MQLRRLTPEEAVPARRQQPLHRRPVAAISPWLSERNPATSWIQLSVDT